MYINNITPVSLANQVWGFTPRTLTGFGTAITAQSAANQVLNAAATVNINGAAGGGGNISLGAKAGAAGSIDVGLWDGTTFFIGSTIASGGTGTYSAIIYDTTLLRFVNNDAVNSGKYTYAEIAFKA